jgi:uncharacterized membrane protein
MGINGAQLHLALNHFPILGLVFSGMILLSGLISDSRIVRRVGLVVLIFSGIMAIPAYFSGESAEEALHGLAGVSKDLIEEHESSAKNFVLLSLSLVVVAATSLWFELQDRSKKIFTMLVLLGTVMVFAVGVWVGHRGGMISHPEIRPDFQINEGQEVIDELSLDDPEKDAE